MATETTTELFETDVIRESHRQPVLVDFWAPWCAPCRLIGPILDRLAAATQRWKLVKVNTEQEPMVAQRMGIRSIPALKLFSGGEMVAELVGALPESQMAAWLEQHVPSEASKQVAAAQQAREAGDTAAAKAQLRAALAAEPGRADARMALAELVFSEDRVEARALVEGLDADPEQLERAEGLMFLCALIERLGELEQAGEVGQRYAAGIRALVAGDHDGALVAWIEVLKRDRKLDDDGARRACVALFHILGEAHAVTRARRPEFASALF